MRKPFIAANWKMHTSRGEAQNLAAAIVQGAKDLAEIEIALFPSFVHLQQLEQLLKKTPILLGAQNLYLGASGAYTGEVSGPMLKDYGCDYVLVGHSERRNLFKEDLDLVAAKFKSAVEFGLKPVLCVGETLEERKQNKTNQIIQKQLTSVFDTMASNDFERIIIAYEPVWAIGTGVTASPEQAQEVHAMIRNMTGKNTRILYGGSVKADNAQSLFAQPDIDGGLVGGASLDANSFLEICRAAVRTRSELVEG